MTSPWTPTTRTIAAGGYHRVVVTGRNSHPVDVTFLRNVWSQLGPYATADPFSETTTSLTFPQLGPLDDLTSPELNWLTEDSLVDIWWIPAITVPPGWQAVDDDTALWTNPITGTQNIACPAYVYVSDGNGGWTRTSRLRGTKVWEGHIASVNTTKDDTSSSIVASCQGALFQPDLTYAKPMMPGRPLTLESLIVDAFDHRNNPTLRTQPMRIAWPEGWTLVAPSFAGDSNLFTPNVRPGQRWTGYTTRSTGAWDKRITGFVQAQLALMLVKPGSGGATPGSQWTVRNMVEGTPGYPAGRTPVLMVRDTRVTPDFAIHAGAQGVSIDLDHDGTQQSDVLYGSGTDLAGTTWRNSVISSDGQRTDYLPLAYSKQSYPYTGNPNLQRTRFLRETYVQFGTGFSQPDATASADQMLARDLDAGYAGTITLGVDPSPTLSRWTLRAGMTMTLQGFQGRGESGLRLHIASTSADVSAGTVDLTVDTRYRDLLTLNEALERTHDALTPEKLLRLNANSVTVEDLQAPWDYSKGSGFIPKLSTALYAHKPTSQVFPYNGWVRDHPPHNSAYKKWYVECLANNSDSRKRWAGPVRVLMSEKGTISRTEVFMVDRFGTLVPKRFHVSFYYVNSISYASMPTDGKTWSPFLPNAFQPVDPSTGEPWTDPTRHQVADGYIVGWGNAEEPAGYSPGLATKGAKATGLLIDEGTWDFDCSANNSNYSQLAPPGKEDPTVISVYAMFYAEHTEPVYFGGRLFRQWPGTSS